PDEQHNSAADTDKRQAPLGRHRRSGKRLRDRHAELLGLLLLGPSLNDLDVREFPRDLTQERALATVRLEPCHLLVWPRYGKRGPRCPAARADVDDRSGKPPHHVNGSEALIDVHTPRLIAVADRSQAGCRKKQIEPAVEASLTQDRSRRTGSARCLHSRS